MKDLTVVIVSCDKYSFVWDAWHYYFHKHWGLNVPVYFVNETKLFTHIDQILINEPIWTKRLREVVKKIPEKHLFVLLEDLLLNESIDDTFCKLYNIFNNFGVDALRIRYSPTKAIMTGTSAIVNGQWVNMLMDYSPYLISFGPTIWDKKYLLECLKKDQSIWKCETSRRMRGRGKMVLDYAIPDWCCNSIKQGKLTKLGQYKIEQHENAVDRH